MLGLKPKYFYKFFSTVSWSRNNSSAVEPSHNATRKIHGYVERLRRYNTDTVMVVVAWNFNTNKLQCLISINLSADAFDFDVCVFVWNL